METSREMLVEQLHKALSDLSSRLCQLHRLPPDKCQPPLRTLYNDQEICEYKLKTCVYKRVTWRIWMWRTPRKFFPYNWAEANAQLYPGRMFTPTTVPGAALGSSPPDLKVLCDLCIWMCSFLPFHRCYQWIQGSSITQHQAGEMAQWLREQAASRGPVFNSQHRHPAVHNKLQGDPMPPSGLWEHCTHICIYPHR